MHRLMLRGCSTHGEIIWVLSTKPALFCNFLRLNAWGFRAADANATAVQCQVQCVRSSKGDCCALKVIVYGDNRLSRVVTLYRYL